MNNGGNENHGVKMVLLHARSTMGAASEEAHGLCYLRNARSALPEPATASCVTNPGRLGSLCSCCFQARSLRGKYLDQVHRRKEKHSVAAQRGHLSNLSAQQPQEDR